jgi:hypothetical protein
MGKTHSKPLAARHGRGTAWARHAMCESALKRFICWHQAEGNDDAATDVVLNYDLSPLNYGQ